MATAVMQKAKQGVAIDIPTMEGLLDRMFGAFDAISHRAFEILKREGHLDGHDAEELLQAEKDLLHPVHLDITESDEFVSVKAEVPDFTERELQVTYCKEIFRVGALPAEADIGKITATLNDGIVQLTMPKRQSLRGPAHQGA